MDPRFAPVPVRKHELMKELDTRGLRITESWHRASSTIARHAHRQATLTVLVDGSFEESYAYRRDMECVAPAIHVRPPGEPHLDRLGTIGAHNLVLELDDTRFEDVSRHSALFDQVQEVRSAELHEISKRLQRELKIDDAASALALEGLTMEMLATASRQEHRGLDRPSTWLLRVRDRLHDDFQHGLGLDELAREADVHPVHLARAFRAAFGASPGEYQRRLRLEWAAHQLTSTKRSIADIAIDAGFSDQSHLTRIFKAAYGQPPGAWRRHREV